MSNGKMIMNPKTNELLLRLEKTDWFSNCGKPLDTSPEVAPVSTWAEALAVCASKAAEDAYLEARAELTVQLSARHGDAYKQWNPRAKQINPLVAKLIQEKLASPAVRAKVPNDAGKIFVDALTWDLQAMCMVREYEDLVPRTRYYEQLEHWYLAGRFPCGWIGEVPDDMDGAFEMGKLAVL